jgi:fructose-bisphosphate aldolase class II
VYFLIYDPINQLSASISLSKNSLNKNNLMKSPAKGYLQATEAVTIDEIRKMVEDKILILIQSSGRVAVNAAKPLFHEYGDGGSKSHPAFAFSHMPEGKFMLQEYSLRAGVSYAVAWQGVNVLRKLGLVAAYETSFGRQKLFENKIAAESKQLRADILEILQEYRGQGDIRLIKDKINYKIIETYLIKSKAFFSEKKRGTKEEMGSGDGGEQSSPFKVRLLAVIYAASLMLGSLKTALGGIYKGLIVKSLQAEEELVGAALLLHKFVDAIMEITGVSVIINPVAPPLYSSKAVNAVTSGIKVTNLDENKEDKDGYAGISGGVKKSGNTVRDSDDRKNQVKNGRNRALRQMERAFPEAGKESIEVDGGRNLKLKLLEVPQARIKDLYGINPEAGSCSPDRITDFVMKREHELSSSFPTLREEIYSSADEVLSSQGRKELKFVLLAGLGIVAPYIIAQIPQDNARQIYIARGASPYFMVRELMNEYTAKKVPATIYYTNREMLMRDGVSDVFLKLIDDALAMSSNYQELDARLSRDVAVAFNSNRKLRQLGNKIYIDMQKAGILNGVQHVRFIDDGVVGHTVLLMKSIVEYFSGRKIKADVFLASVISKNKKLIPHFNAKATDLSEEVIKDYLRPYDVRSFDLQLSAPTDVLTYLHFSAGQSGDEFNEGHPISYVKDEDKIILNPPGILVNDFRSILLANGVREYITKKSLSGKMLFPEAQRITDLLAHRDGGERRELTSEQKRLVAAIGLMLIDYDNVTLKDVLKILANKQVPAIDPFVASILSKEIELYIDTNKSNATRIHRIKETFINYLEFPRLMSAIVNFFDLPMEGVQVQKELLEIYIGESDNSVINSLISNEAAKTLAEIAKTRKDNLNINTQEEPVILSDVSTVPSEPILPGNEFAIEQASSDPVDYGKLGFKKVDLKAADTLKFKKNDLLVVSLTGRPQIVKVIIDVNTDKGSFLVKVFYGQEETGGVETLDISDVLARLNAPKPEVELLSSQEKTAVSIVDRKFDWKRNLNEQDVRELAEKINEDKLYDNSTHVSVEGIVTIANKNGGFELIELSPAEVKNISTGLASLSRYLSVKQAVLEGKGLPPVVIVEDDEYRVFILDGNMRIITAKEFEKGILAYVPKDQIEKIKQILSNSGAEFDGGRQLNNSKDLLLKARTENANTETDGGTTGSLLKRIVKSRSRGMAPRALLAANPRTPFVAKGIFKAALELDAPVLFELALSQMVVGTHKGYSGLTAQEFADMIHMEAKEMGFPQGRYALHADHISVEKNTPGAIQLAKDMIKATVEAGYTSFTIDASYLFNKEGATLKEQLADNINVTSELAKYIARLMGDKGYALEVEVGEIGKINPFTGEKELTTVEEAVTFIEELHKNGVFPDLLAINNGSVHGYTYEQGKKKAKTGIDLVRTKEIASALLNYSVYLHQSGGSDVPEEILKQFPESGILKLSVGADYMMAALNNLPSEIYMKMRDWTLKNKAEDARKKGITGEEEITGKYIKYAIKELAGEIKNIDEASKEKIAAAAYKTTLMYLRTLHAQGMAAEVAKLAPLAETEDGGRKVKETEKTKPSPALLKKAISIDASYGEGGGQVVRTAIALSILTKKPVIFHGIRKNRPQFGLRRVHVANVGLFALISNAETRGNEHLSTQLVFIPHAVSGGAFYLTTLESIENSIGPIFQGILPVLTFADKESKVIIKGGTHLPGYIPIEHVQQILLPILNLMGIETGMTINRYGWGIGGETELRVSPVRGTLQSIDFKERGNLRKIKITILVSHFSLQEGKEIGNEIAQNLAGFPIEIEVKDVTLMSSGNSAISVFMNVAFEKTIAGFDATISDFSARGELINKVTAEFYQYYYSGASVDQYAADVVVLFMALAKGKSLIIVPEVTTHLLTAIHVIETFLPVKFKLQTETIYERPSISIEVEGIGKKRTYIPKSQGEIKSEISKIFENKKSVYRINRKDIRSISELARDYSLLKFGDVQKVEKFADELVNKIEESIPQLKLNKQNWSIVSPPFFSLPSSSYMLAKKASDKLGIELIQAQKVRSLGNYSILATKKARKEEVKDSILIDSSIVKGKKVILIDDAVVSGATSKETIKALIKAGVKDIKCFFLIEFEILIVCLQSI